MKKLIIEEKKEKKWMQDAFDPETKGALHKALGIPEDEEIPVELMKKKKKELQKAAEGEKKLSKADLKLLRQITLALTARDVKKEGKRRKKNNDIVGTQKMSGPAGVGRSVVWEDKQLKETTNRQTLEDFADNLSGWMANHDPGSDFNVLILRLLASLPGGDKAEEAGFESMLLGWREMQYIEEMIANLQDSGDVAYLVDFLLGPDEDYE